MVNNFVLGEVKSTKVLGLFIDKKLVWSEHIDYINNKITKNILTL